MNPNRYIINLLLFMFASTSYATEIEGDIKCYQNGQLILSAQDRVRAFKAFDPMILITDMDLGQVNEVKIKIYASSHADVACVIKDPN